MTRAGEVDAETPHVDSKVIGSGRAWVWSDNEEN